MAKVLVILADGFEEIEAFSPIDLLRRAGACVTVAGLGKKEITSSRKLRIVCDTTLDSTDAEGWDAVVLPGGMPGAVNLASSKEVTQRIISTFNAGKLVCAICASPALVLAPLGVLDGKTAVCYPGMEVQNQKITFAQNNVFTDKNIITARGAGCSIEFALAIVGELFGKEAKKDLAEKIVY